MPGEDEEKNHPGISIWGFNSPFEEFAVAHALNQLGIPCVYVRAIYMTGSYKIEKSSDLRKYESHKDVLDPEGGPILQENHNFITIRGYYNGSDQWVAEQTGSLYVPMDLTQAVDRGLIDGPQCRLLLERVKENLRSVNYDGSLLHSDDLLLAIDGKGELVKDRRDSLLVVICNFEHIWKCSDDRPLKSKKEKASY